MPNIIKPVIHSVTQGIQRLFGRSKPTVPKLPPRITVTGGHRGVAAGDLEERQHKPYTEEEVQKWGNVQSEEAEDFIYGGMPLHVNSTNVASSTYHHETNTMDVEFLDGSMYRYSSVTPDEALTFVQAQSKGGWVWSTLRIRGTKNGHRKPYSRIR